VNAPERVHEFAHVADPVLEEITDAAGAIGEQLRRVLALDILAEDQHRRSRNLPASLDRRPQSFVALARWHPHIDNRHIRAMREDGLDERWPVTHLGDHDAARLLDQPRDSLANEGRILRDDDPERRCVHGRMMHQRSEPARG
jgi:hypothetical protein